MTNREYYELLLRSKDGIITMTAFGKNGGKQIFRCSSAEEIEEVVSAHLEGYNTYIDPNLRRTDLPSGLRGGDEDVTVVNCLTADVDIRGPAHTEQKLPETIGDALKPLEGFPPPTLLIDSGYGVYGVWVFKEPIPIAMDADREKVGQVFSGFGKAVMQAYEAAGYKIDNVFNISHLFRVPGSRNNKLDSPAECRILESSGIFYTLEDFAAYKQFLGYRKGADGLPEIVPEEAEIVRSIYRMFMAGKNPTAIARSLTQQKIPTPGGKENWQSATVESILTNEKYKGSALLQKRYTVDFLTKTMKVNEGEVPQYYVEDSHPAIIRPEEWEAVQAEITRRKSSGKRHDCGSPFSGKILCGDCGSVYGSKVWHSNDKYRRVIWQCNSKFKNETKCATPHVDERVLKERFLRTLSQYMTDPEERIEGLRYVQKSMTDTDFIDADIEKAERDLERLSAMVRSCIMMNASANLTEEAYTQQYTDLTRQYEEKKAEYEALLERKRAMEATAVVFSGILFRLTELDEIPIDFDEALWNTLVDYVTVYADERIVFSFMDGTEITEML